MLLTATFRLLYSGEAGLQRKLEAAEQLVEALLGSGSPDAVAEAAALPPLVAAHYLRSLVEWSSSALIKGSGADAGGKKAKKQQQQQAKQAADGQQQAARMEPRCWAVLALVLSSQRIPASQPLPAALLPAATAALQQAGQLPDSTQQVELLGQLAALLRLLAGKFGSSFRPGIEHAAAVAEAALAGRTAASHATASSTAAWEEAACAAVQLLAAAAAGHPNQRKVWDAAVPRLLPLLASAAFPADGTAAGSQLAGSCRQVLEAVLFSQQHVVPLATAAATEFAAALAEAQGGGAAAAAAAAEQEDEAEEGDMEVDGAAAAGAAKQAQHGAAGGYAAQLFAALRQQVAARELPLELLRWMVGCFCAALKQHRRVAETEAELTGQADRRSKVQQQQDEEGGEEGGAGGSSQRKPAGGSALSVSADFHFWLALLRTLTPHVTQQQQGGSETSELSHAVGGMALLAGALRQHQLYRPTQDPAGQQRLMLQQLADTALALAQQQHGSSEAAAAAAADVVPAALGVIQGILAVEHRVIQQQLPLLWPLLLHSPQAAAGTHAGSSGASGGGVAVAVACSLVAAFAELRQLEVLLRSLTDALLQPAPEASAAPASGAAAAAVLGSRQFQAALSTAVQQLPSGQVPMLLRLVAELAPRLGGAAQENSRLAADLCCCCLASLHIDLTTAAAAAAAAASLVAALAPLMLPALSAAAAGGTSSSGKKEKRKGKGQAQASLLPALLRLYRRALLVHGRCAGLHPQVAPLPGQHVQPPNSGSSSAAGYFAPLLGDGASAAPDLAELLASPAASSGADLRQALLQAAEQRVQVLHQQQRYLTCTCPVTLLPEPGTEQALQQAAQQAQQAQHAQQQLDAVEGELRQLADVLSAAAAQAAAAADDSMLDALQLAAGALPILQEWAPPAPLQQLLQACLRQAASGGPSSPAAQQPSPAAQQPTSAAVQLCRCLLLSEDLVEQRQLAALLPAAAAAELGAALSAALGGAAEEAEGGSAQKKRRKGKEGTVASRSGHLSDHAAALLRQLGRLAIGKALKSSSWAAAVEGSSASIAAAAADLGDSSGSSKKRKQQQEAAGGSGLEAVQRQLQLLAQLPLAHLQPEAAAGLAAVAVGSLLCCWEGSLGPSKAGQPAGSALPASAACLQLLARLAGGGPSGSLEGQQQLLPAVLQAALTAAMQSAAAAGAASDGAEAAQLGCVAATAENSGHVMQAVCTTQLAAGDGSMQQTASRLSAQLQQQQASQQWAGAVLAQGCLAACYAAAHDASRRAAADIVCSGGSSKPSQQAAAALIGSAAAALEPAVAAALPAAAKAAVGGNGQAQLLAGSLYSCAALLLRLRCCDHPAAEALEQAAGAGSNSVVGTMAAGFQLAAELLGQLATGQQAAASGLLVQHLLEYVAACCSVTGRMRPAASSSHYASLLALLLHLLAQQQVQGGVPPSRRTIPFAATFPAAAAAAAAATGGSAARTLLLDALRELVAGSSSQQLLLPLRYVEATLPAAGSGSSSSNALPLCELLLVLLEAASGGQQQRLLAQHAERMSGLLTSHISSTAYGSLQPPAQQLSLPGVQQLAAAILAAGEGGSAASVASAREAVPAAPAPPPVAATEAAEVAPASAPPAAQVAALCTALRALESLAARPKLFQLSAAAVSSMAASMAAVWTAFAEQPGAAAGEAAALPGFCFCLDATNGAGLFAGSCHLLLALLRHRQQELRRCLPLVLQALRALLRFLVASELSARLQQHLPASSAAAAGSLGPSRQRAGPAAQERQWRIKCAELLASVLTELAGLKEAGVGRYCPHLLADYLVLAAAPPSGKSKALLRFASPARALAVAGAGGSDAAAAAADPGAAAAAMAAAAAAEEEEVLGGEPMSREAAAALRQGAYALYGACSAAEIQFLYASLAAGGGGGGARGGSAAVASWRAALAALKADFEKHHKYTGKV